MHKLSHLPPALRRLAVLAATAVLAFSGAQAESMAFLALPEEAPESVFDVKLGSAEAELLVNGSWNASATLQGGLLLGSAGDLSLADEQPLLFSQVPDLYISFLLYRKLFAEIRVSDSASETRYSLGYRGGEGELLRELRLGNDGISFPVLPFLSLGSGSYRSFGLAASLGTGNFSGRAMLRYDQAKRVVKKFVGGSEVTETVIQASAFLRGRWFVAPVSTTVSNLVLYAESASGTLTGSDGGLYRRLEVSEFSYSASTGLISLAKKATTRVIAYYPEYVGGTYTDDVTLGGRACLLLYDPGDLSADGLDRDTLVLGRYVVSAAAGGDAFVRDRATGLRDDAYSVRIDSSGYAEVVSGTSTDPQTPGFRQPFAAAMADIYATDYSGTDAAAYLPALTKEIVVLVYASGSTITIDSDVIDGSVEVRRNGIPDYAFTVDSSAGKLELATAPGLDEEIEVSYLRQSSERSSGSLAAGLGGFFDLGDGSSAWTALGVRWSVPGTSYAESGMSDPGSVVFTAGEKDEKGAFTQGFSLAGRWSTEVASGRYRIEGMESSGSQSSSFWPEATGSFSVVEEKESLLASPFPSLSSSLHSSGSTQQALHVTASTGTELRLVKFIDEIPASALRTFSFFARGTPGGASISVVMDQGSNGTADDELSIVVQPQAVSPAWRRYILRYGYGSTTVYYQDSEDDGLHALASSDASGVANLDLSSACRLSIAISGASAATELWMDELVLEDSAGAAALLAKGGLRYTDKDWSLGFGAVKILKGIDFGADASGALSQSPFASGGSSLATALGPLDFSASIRVSAAEGAVSARGGHALALAQAGLPLSAKDVFDVDPRTGAFGRSDSFSFELGSWFGIGAGQVTTWAGDNASSSGLFSQSWKASVNALKGALSAQLEASNRANPEGFEGLTGGYFSDWLEGYAYALPAFEAESTKRTLSLSSTAGLGQDRYFVKCSLSIAGLPSISGSPRDDEVLLRLQAPLAFGKAVLVTPYYQRSWKARVAGSGSGMADFASLALSDLASNRPFWTSVPFSELFGKGVLDSFAEYTNEKGIDSASYSPELGMALARDSGSSWVDLLVPATLALAWRNQASREDDSLSVTGILSFTLKYEAINVFGGFGAFPLAAFFDSDEYSSACQLLLKKTSGEDAVRPTIILQNLATFYANDNRDSLSLDNRFSYAREASSTTWSEDLKLSLSLVSGRSWLLDLYKLVLGPAETKAASGDPGSKGRISIVSEYTEGLAKATPVARTIFMANGALTSTTTDADGTELAIEATESVEFKVTVPQKLGLSFKPAASQTRDADSGSTVFGLSLTISATVSF
jgi:hypothetical protein